jgi:cytochrome c
MCSWGSAGRGALLLCLGLALGLAVQGAEPRGPFAGLGRPATEAELAAWDIDVGPDFAGLPPGSGSVMEGEELWIGKCASCHGDFGDSNEMFSPLALGNVTEQDIETGRVASLTDPTRTRTTLMKVATVSTLWDYINRAMPWNAPKSLATDEVYALVAYLLNLGYIVDEEFVLSHDNIAEVQARLPNRHGMTTDHGLWSVDGKPDVVGSDCTRDCAVDTTVSSSIPDFAMNAHGNLRDQMRVFGPYPGIDTGGEGEAEPAAAALGPGSLLEDNGCNACHRLHDKLVGPALAEVRKKYAGREDAVAYLAGKIRNGGSGVWGGVMPPMPQVSERAATEIAVWLAGGELKSN